MASTLSLHLLITLMLTDIIKTIKDCDMLHRGEHVLVALSGGVDSSVLLDVLIKCREELGISVSAAHLNHMLRGKDADNDEAFVREKCEKLGVPFVSERIDITSLAQKSGQSTELCAREVRYGFLRRAKAELGADKIATAHNANDNLETVIFNLSRGGGIDGMCGIPPVREDIIRPLIFVPRQEIEKYAACNGIEFCEDKTNAETVYTRNKIRHNIVPEILKINAGAIKNASRSSRILRDDADFLKNEAHLAAERVVADENGCDVKKLYSLHPALFGRVCENFAAKAAGEENYVLEYCHVTALRALCESAVPSGMIHLPGGVCARREYENLVFEKAGQYEAAAPVKLCEGEFHFGCFRVFVKKTVKTEKINNSVNTFLISCGRIQDGLVLRSRAVGDEIKLPKRPTKSLKKLFIEKRIPKAQREKIPVIADGEKTVAVYGIGTDERYIPQNGDEIYAIEINKGCWENEK